MKIGEGNQPHGEPTVKQYQKDLDFNAEKFLNALQSYNLSQDSEEKAQLKGIMDQQLALIRSAVQEIKRSGINKQEVKVENDYKQFMSDNSDTSLQALEEDVQTLRDYNKLG
jgi:hypothetical protein